MFRGELLVSGRVPPFVGSRRPNSHVASFISFRLEVVRISRSGVMYHTMVPNYQKIEVHHLAYISYILNSTGNLFVA